jgi:hypothetical protein
LRFSWQNPGRARNDVPQLLFGTEDIECRFREELVENGGSDTEPSVIARPNMEIITQAGVRLVWIRYGQRPDEIRGSNSNQTRIRNETKDLLPSGIISDLSTRSEGSAEEAPNMVSAISTKVIASYKSKSEYEKVEVLYTTHVFAHIASDEDLQIDLRIQILNMVFQLFYGNCFFRYIESKHKHGK